MIICLIVTIPEKIAMWNHDVMNLLLRIDVRMGGRRFFMKMLQYLLKYFFFCAPSLKVQIGSKAFFRTINTRIFFWSYANQLQKCARN